MGLMRPLFRRPPGRICFFDAARTKLAGGDFSVGVDSLLRTNSGGLLLANRVTDLTDNK